MRDELVEDRVRTVSSCDFDAGASMSPSLSRSSSSSAKSIPFNAYEGSNSGLLGIATTYRIRSTTLSTASATKEITHLGKKRSGSDQKIKNKLKRGAVEPLQPSMLARSSTSSFAKPFDVGTNTEPLLPMPAYTPAHCSLSISEKSSSLGFSTPNGPELYADSKGSSLQNDIFEASEDIFQQIIRGEGNHLNGNPYLSHTPAHLPTPVQLYPNSQTIIPNVDAAQASQIALLSQIRISNNYNRNVEDLIIGDGASNMIPLPEQVDQMGIEVAPFDAFQHGCSTDSSSTYYSSPEQAKYAISMPTQSDSLAQTPESARGAILNVNELQATFQPLRYQEFTSISIAEQEKSLHDLRLKTQNTNNSRLAAANKNPLPIEKCRTKEAKRQSEECESAKRSMQRITAQSFIEQVIQSQFEMSQPSADPSNIDSHSDAR